MQKMTLKDIEEIPREYLTPADVAPCFGVDPQDIRDRIWEDRSKEINSFLFPVVVIGKRIKIPKAAFLNFMRGNITNPTGLLKQ